MLKELENYLDGRNVIKLKNRLILMSRVLMIMI